MQFAIMLSGRLDHPHHKIALRLCRQALDDGHQLNILFFTGDAVASGCKNTGSSNQADWQQLARDSGAELILCSRSADALGIHSEHVAPYYGLGGLALWIDASLTADRCLQFGGE